MNNRCKENILPIIKKNVFTLELGIENDEFRTRLYSDSYSVYQNNYFINMGYILHRLNHSLWLGQVGQGLFHTNSMEGLWTTIKRLTNNFSGINFIILANLENKGIRQIVFLNGWICFALFLRDCERENYNEELTKNYLIEIIKIDN